MQYGNNVTCERYMNNMNDIEIYNILMKILLRNDNESLSIHLENLHLQ